MSTKVKGDKIKEGSIPLSALDNAIVEDINVKYGLSGYVGCLTSSNPKFVGKQPHYYVLVQDKIYNTFGGDIVLTDGPKIIIHVTRDYEGTYLEITDDISNIDYYRTIKIFSSYKEVPIPNTVIKTTLQTLSNTDKNQALANLGIDPVVWKYMMNPYGITIGQPIPEDLANIIYDYNTNEFLPIIKNVCYIAENSGIHQYIVYVASAYNSIFTMDPENTTFMYEYNSEHKVFLIP